MIKISLVYILLQDTTRLVILVDKRYVELYTYSIDITQQQEHFPQF